MFALSLITSGVNADYGFSGKRNTCNAELCLNMEYVVHGIILIIPMATTRRAGTVLNRTEPDMKHANVETPSSLSFCTHYAIFKLSIPPDS